MADIDWAQLAREMLVAAGEVVHEQGGEVLPCLRSRFDEMAKLSAKITNDYIDGYITQEQYKELEDDLARLQEGAIEDCQDLGMAVVQAAVNAAVDKLWATLKAAVASA